MTQTTPVSVEAPSALCIHSRSSPRVCGSRMRGISKSELEITKLSKTITNANRKTSLLSCPRWASLRTPNQRTCQDQPLMTPNSPWRRKSSTSCRRLLSAVLEFNPIDLTKFKKMMNQALDFIQTKPIATRTSAEEEQLLLVKTPRENPLENYVIIKLKRR